MDKLEELELMNIRKTFLTEYHKKTIMIMILSIITVLGLIISINNTMKTIYGAIIIIEIILATKTYYSQKENKENETQKDTIKAIYFINYAQHLVIIIGLTIITLTYDNQFLYNLLFIILIISTLRGIYYWNIWRNLKNKLETSITG